MTDFNEEKNLLDVHPGDIVVFFDDSQVRVKEVFGSTLILQNERVINAFSENIFGFIKKRVEANVPETTVPVSNIPQSTPKPVENKETTFTYSELFSLMEKADHSDLGFSKGFWHYTHFDNLVKIIKDRKFISRYDSKYDIPYDNMKKNATSHEVMSNNASWKTKMHARFYLRPLNKPYFSFYHNLNENEQKRVCIIRIKKEALYSSYKSTFLYFQNAVNATDDVYDKSHELNRHYKDRFSVYNFDYFNFKETYSLYDPNQDHLRSLFQEAEFMVWKELSTMFIDKIFFKSSEVLQEFLKVIRTTLTEEEYNDLRLKCSVDRTYIGY